LIIRKNEPISTKGVFQTSDFTQLEEFGCLSRFDFTLGIARCLKRFQQGATQTLLVKGYELEIFRLHVKARTVTRAV
jgi:hypothetical protein